jgi:Dyp-type peroxidase family
MIGTHVGYLNQSQRIKLENRYLREKRRQPGIAFPSASNQEHLFIIRFNISDHLSVSREEDKAIVRTGLNSLCQLFDKIVAGKKRIDELTEVGDIKSKPLSDFNFSSMIGFGLGFFRKLNIPKKNWPRNLKEMPDYHLLSDSTPYTLFQTDFIVQLGAQDDYVNRWVFQNQVGIVKRNERSGLTYDRRLKQYASHTPKDSPPDIYTAIRDWATITDIHAGFQRLDGKNLLGFNDGISNPFRLSNNVIWTTSADENEKLKDGTYMVFQKIEHNLEKWQNMDEEKQELWIGRSKHTGLLLGTLSKHQDQRLALDMHSDNEIVRQIALKKWKRLYDKQKDPEEKFFDSRKSQHRSIQLECPVWSHVRKANPREADGEAKRLIFRRGYLFIEGGINGKFRSGLLFICFQRNVENGFEYIKKNFLNNKNFPIPQLRKFSVPELQKRRREGRVSINELKSTKNRMYADLSIESDTESTGKEGLSGPSELGVYPQGQFPITVTLGGGYYFIPPIPNQKISDIGEQFFG